MKKAQTPAKLHLCLAIAAICLISIDIAYLRLNRPPSVWLSDTVVLSPSHGKGSEADEELRNKIIQNQRPTAPITGWEDNSPVTGLEVHITSDDRLDVYHFNKGSSFRELKTRVFFDRLFGLDLGTDRRTSFKDVSLSRLDFLCDAISHNSYPGTVAITSARPLRDSKVFPAAFAVMLRSWTEIRYVPHLEEDPAD